MRRFFSPGDPTMCADPRPHQKSKTNRKLPAILCQRGQALLLSSLLIASPAFAGNADEIPVGSQASLVSAAVTATIADGAAGYYNPAGLAHNHRPTLDASASVYGIRLVNSTGLLEDQVGTKSDTDFIDWVLIPSAVAYTREVSPRLNLSFGVFVPRATDTVLRARLRTFDGAEWRNTARVENTDYHFTLSGGYAALPNLRLGASLVVIYSTQIESYQFAGGQTGLDTSTFGFSETYESSQYGMAMLFGVQWDITKDLVFGASVRTPTLSLY
ncbi:MAG: outer membrane protein transport protein, partial [Polyangiaceae bacterium]|nr:outer membrane protein transport protein [Polyangiaceae bacterium]